MKSYKALLKKILIFLIGFMLCISFFTLADFKIRQSITDSVAYIKKMVFTQDGTPISTPNVVIDGSGIVLVSGNIYGTNISGNQLCIGNDCKTSWPNNSPWLSGNNFLYYTGNIGVGTNNPQAKLDVNGSIKVGYTDTCNSSYAGSIRYNSGTNIVEYCNSTEWVGVKFFANCLMGIQTINTHPYNVPNMNHGTTSIQTSVISITGGTRTYQQTFMCDNGTVSAQGVETNVLNSCNAGYTWDGNSSCLPNNCLASTQTVNGHNYAVPGFNHGSTTNQLSIVLISNGNRTYQQTFACSLGNVSTQGGEVNTSNSCNTGYTWNSTTSTCNVKTTTVSSAVYNARTFSYTTFTLSYGAPQIKTSTALSILGGTSTLTATFTLGVDGTTVTLSNASESVSCNAGYSVSGNSCVPNNCNSSTQIVNGHTYSVPAFNHGTTTTQISIILITNGNRTYQQTFSCNLGNVSTQGGETNTSNNCNSNYVWDGTSCSNYEISNSLRFDSSRSTYLSRTPSIVGNQKIWTFSSWVKKTSSTFTIFGAINGLGNDKLMFSSDYLFMNFNGYQLTTLNTYNHNWNHIIISVDTSQSISTDRFKLYINGIQVHSFSSANYPPQNYLTAFNSKVFHSLGRNTDPNQYLDGYMSEVNFIDGQALGPENFGQTLGGKRLPKAYTGTYGTNGFYLDFKDGANLGKDVSGRTNNWTVNNHQVTDQMIDTPTNNFTTLNPLTIGHPTWNPTGNISNGGLTMTITDNHARESDKYASSGKYYAEVFMTQNPVSVTMVGVRNFGFPISGVFGNIGDVAYINNGYKRVGTDSSYGSSYTQGDVIGIALDLDNRIVQFYKNNFPQGAISLNPSVPYGFGVGGANPTGTRILNFNFGQGGQSGLQWCSLAGGYFKYCPPTGFKALSSKNIRN